jgi:PhoH-like ATPase
MNLEMKSDNKIFILDTNVILFDHSSIYNFQEHDVVIPMVVLEEIDNFKRGNDHLNFEARQFIRELDAITNRSHTFFREGVALGEEKGRLYVYYEDTPSPEIEKVLTQKKADNRILALAIRIQSEYPGRRVVLVSKDINLRMKALAFTIEAEDYLTGKVLNIDKLYSGRDTLENFPEEIITRLYKEHGVGMENWPKESDDVIANQFFILRNGSHSALAFFHAQENLLERVEKRHAYGIEPRNAEQTFSLDALMRDDIQLVALTGKAGTGKTLLALAAALEQRKQYRQIYLARPIVPLSNRDMGYLPGTIESKMDPYMQPLHDNLSVIRHQYPQNSKENQKIDEMLESEKLYIAPLAYIRGRSLDNIFFIVDEAQNLTPLEVKTIITRAGENTKIIFTGDIHQIDTPYLDKHSNGLTYLIDRMKGQQLFATVNLVKGERSGLAEIASNLL